MNIKSSSLRLHAVAPLLLLCIGLTHNVAAQNTPTTNAVPTIPPEKWDRLKQVAEGDNVPIIFYGMVIDQNGNALPNARVVLRVQQTQFNPQYFVVPKYVHFDRTTGVDGHFFLDGISGRGVDIESVTEPGYELEKGVSPFYGTVSGTVENPVKFVLWDKNHKTQMISGDKYFEFIPDGRDYVLDLDKQTITQATNSEGDFQFRLTRPKGVGKWDHFDWSFDFEAKQGNVLQKTEVGYSEMLFAPKDGFTKAEEQIQRKTDQPWRGSGSEQFYIKLRDGQAYGKLSVIWDTVAATAGPKTNEAGIRIQYTINPTGSALVR